MKYNKKIIHGLIVMAALFLSLVGYLTYFQLFSGPELATSGNNPRTLLDENKILRGIVYDRNGVKLAYSEKNGENQSRIYPYNGMYAHIIGYNSSRYGRTMIEDKYNSYLMGSDIVNSVLGFGEVLKGGEKQGADLTLTLDHSLQKRTYNMMSGKKGAAVALNPETGEVLAMVSLPSFNPNESVLKSEWEKLIQDEGTPLISRAASGLYQPGSSFKTVVTASAVENMQDGQVYEDTGSIEIDGKSFHNYGNKVYGILDMERAFAVSSNTYFINTADILGYSKLKSTAEKFMFNKDIDFDLPLAKSSLLSDKSRLAVAAAGMGQGDVLATPMQMALVVAAIANEGVMPQPYMVEKATAKGGATVYSSRQKMLGRSVSAYTAERLSQMMRECVLSGTGTAANVSGVNVYGKTGTAETGTEGKDHAWFVCYAEKDGHKIAIAVIAEYSSGTGADVAAPVAREMIKTWRNGF